MNEYDVVVGGGGAGLSADLVLSRARRRVAVIDADQPRNAPAAHMHGFLGWDGAPRHLLKQGRDEVTSYGGELIAGTVTDLRPAPSHHRADDAAAGPRFEVTLADGQRLTARRVLVTTGLRDDIPDIGAVRERWGRDLLHCPYCHGYEVRDQPLGVLGGSPEAVVHALLIEQWSAPTPNRPAA
jgi:thioredoxin reductase